MVRTRYRRSSARGRRRSASRPTASSSPTSAPATTARWRCASTASPTPPTPGATSSPQLAEAGYRAVAPFQRGYAPTAVPADGLYQTGALAADAIALHEALGGDGDAVHRRPRLGRAGRRTARPCTRPSGGEGRRHGRAARRRAGHGLRRRTSTSCKRSWYMFFFQHPLADLVVAANDLAFVDMLWATGRRASTPPTTSSSRQGRRCATRPTCRRARLLPRRARRRPDATRARRRPGGDAGRCRRSRCCTSTAATTAASASRSPRRRAAMAARQRHDRDRRRRRPLPPPRAARRRQRPHPGVPRRDRHRRGRPPCPTASWSSSSGSARRAVMVAPVLARARRAGPADRLHAGRPGVPRGRRPRCTTPTSRSAGTTTSRRCRR